MVRTGKRGLVLGASIIGSFCLLWFTGSLYPLWSADSPLDEVMIADQRLLLAEAGDKCVLKVLPDNYLLELDVGLPCYFQRMEGMLLIESFPEFSVDRIFAVIGTSLNEETRNSFGLDPSIVCAEKAQGIIIDRGQLVAVDQVADGGVWCRDEGVDRKRYWEFAESFRD